jgi:hypothetical protein
LSLPGEIGARRHFLRTMLNQPGSFDLNMLND